MKRTIVTAASVASAIARVAIPAYLGRMALAGRPTTLLGPVVEPRGRRPDTADHLLGEPGRLASDCVPKLGARGDVVERPLRLVAREDPVRDLDGSRARERRGDETLQLAARSELGGDALEHAVADERACDLLRQRAGERSVEDPRDLGRGEDLVDRLLERSPPRPRRGPRREERRASGRVCKP